MSKELADAELRRKESSNLERLIADKDAKIEDLKRDAETVGSELSSVKVKSPADAESSFNNAILS